MLNIAGSAAGTWNLGGFDQTLIGLTQTANAAATVTNTSATTSNLTFNPGANQTYTFGGQAAGGIITGTGNVGNINLIKTGARTQVLAGANFLNGNFTLTAGVLSLTGVNTITSGNVTIGGTGGTLLLGNTTALGTNFTIGLALNGGTLDINGQGGLTVGALSGTGGTITDNATTAGSTVLSTASNTDSTFAGAISNGTLRLVSLTKGGTGRLTLTGSNNFSGLTAISAGALNVQNNNALGTTTSGTLVYSGAALELQNATAVTIGAEALTLSGTGTGLASGALRNVTGNNSFGGAITLAFGQPD